MTDTTNYVEHACTIRVPGWQIPAALTLPANHDSLTELPSAILLVPGSLFSDVNGDFPAWNSFPHVYAYFARQLSARGHAVFRYAKLGPGTGSVPIEEPNAIPRTWEGRVQITAGALEAMRRELAERGVKVKRLIGAGHSEGAVAVSCLALTPHGREVDAIVLLSGPSVGIISIMREQFGGDEAAAKRAEEVIAGFPEEGQRYMHDVEATDPTQLVREMSHRVLVVQGGNDSSVRTHHGERLRDAAGARGSYVFFEDLTHMYKIVPEGTSPQDAFGWPGETDPRVADRVSEWVVALP